MTITCAASDWIEREPRWIEVREKSAPLIREWITHKVSAGFGGFAEESDESNMATDEASVVDFQRFARNREAGDAILRWLEEDPEPNLEAEEEFRQILDSVRSDFA